MRSFVPGALALFLATGCSILLDFDALEAGGTGAGPAGGDVAFTDDELDGEFGAGELDGTAWIGDRVALAPGGASGELRSRLFDAESDGAAWQTLSWVPFAPYGKPLPELAARETGYAEAGVDMDANVLLLHLDGAGALAHGDRIADASGRGNDAVASVPAGASLPFGAGRFGQAIEDTPSTYVYVDLGTTEDFDFGTGDFTWALWVNTTEDCAGNKVHLGVEDVGEDRVHLWLGCAPHDITWALCAPGEAGGRAAGFLSGDHGDDGGGFCGATRIDDGAWHHLALVKSGHTNAAISLYVDGRVDHTTTLGFIAPFDFFDAPQLAIGAFSGDTYQASGAFDEVAIWRRALAPDEIAALHRRGALRLAFQVRSCGDAACAGGGAFAGPGLDGGAWFSEPAAALAPGAEVRLDALPPARFFQYRALFESDREGESPGLAAVTATARR